MHELTSSFDVRDLIERNPTPFLLIFTANGCPHSNDLKEILKDLHRYTQNGVEVFSFDVSLDPMLGMAYAIAATPTTLLIHDSAVVHRWVGVHRFHHYYDICDALLKSSPVYLLDQVEAMEQTEITEEEIPF